MLFNPLRKSLTFC